MPGDDSLTDNAVRGMTLRGSVQRRCAIAPSPRALQAAGMFDLTPVDSPWPQIALELPAQWTLGAIVGPSGSGKSTLARAWFGEGGQGCESWPEDRCILDAFPNGMGIGEITDLLCGAGLSSAPAWLAPFHALSTGQQFRARLALAIARQPPIALIDEFANSLDRTTARLSALAVAKLARRRGQKLIAITSHEDVLDWLGPDWIYSTGEGGMIDGRLARGRVRRPSIRLRIARTTPAAWARFKDDHYLSASLHPSAACFVALASLEQRGGDDAAAHSWTREEPAAFAAVLHFPHPRRPGWREHRLVCLSRYQGAGIGSALSAYVASLFAGTGKPYFSATAHPGIIRHRLASPLWQPIRPAQLARPHRGSGHGMRRAGGWPRLVGGFEYIGPARPRAARCFGIIAGD